ncbi:MAG: histone deacetylase [Myxococcota bacterium]|nr:histone deacetylase [Myxococcota bacterium]
MAAHPATAVVEDPRYKEHSGPAGHPERPERLDAVHAAIAARADEVRHMAPRAATPDEILRVHTPDHLALVEEAAGRAPIHLDPDTFVSPRSHEVARLAAGASVELALRVARGEFARGLAAVRPPGHHAEAVRAMGFCLFNNVAIAARAVQAEEGVGRVLVLDWDVHHGNGTQHSFEEDDSVLYASTHQFPYYPGTGDAIEAGRGDGEGATLNVPLPAGCGDVEYIGAFQRLLAPVVRDYRPEMVFVSCGFDAHVDDPLAAMNVTGEGFRAMARIVRALADELCDGRLVLVLEGGYALSGLQEGTSVVLDELLAETPGPLPETAALTPGSPLAGVVERVSAVHRANHPEVGSG